VNQSYTPKSCNEWIEDVESREVADSASESKMSSVELRDTIESDLDHFYAFQLDPEASQLIGFAPRSKAESDAHWAKILSDDVGVNQTILADGQVAGNIVCFILSGEREVGYRLGREFWGKGIATKALSLFLLQVTDRPLFAHVAKRNHASVRVLEKNGFAVTGEDKMLSEVTGEVIEEWVMKLV
jgi:RimJ/RimL family protein N-acetyltransferase